MGRHILLQMIALGLAGSGGSIGAASARDSTPAPVPFVAAPAAIPTTGATLRLGRCVNMSDQLEAPNEGEWGRGIVDADLSRIAARGFTAIRLPVRFSNHALANPPYTIDPAFMARVRHVTDLAVANHLAVIIDMHHYLELFTDPTGHADRFAQLWRQIGNAFRDEPASVYFELINEPNTHLDATNLLAVQAPALAEVRATNPTRKVVIDGASYASFDQMTTSPYPADPNVVPTFHYYDPQNFGFDRAPWMSPPRRTEFGNAQDIADLRIMVARIRAFIAASGRVPFAGEIGAHESKPDPQRARYYALVSAAFASAGVQSCAWGYTNTHQLWRDGSGWVGNIADGIVTTTTLPSP